MSVIEIFVFELLIFLHSYFFSYYTPSILLNTFLPLIILLLPTGHLLVIMLFCHITLCFGLFPIQTLAFFFIYIYFFILSLPHLSSLQLQTFLLNFFYMLFYYFLIYLFPASHLHINTVLKIFSLISIHILPTLL